MKPTRAKRGQALIMITTSLIALCGVMGLAVDLGWGYFVKKSAQRAADAAAMATVEQALLQVGQVSTFVCGVNLTCQSNITSCAAAPASPPATNIDNGCLYAQRNGFTYTGNNGRQNVTVQANTTKPIPTAPNLNADYWATVRVTERIPQLFSAVLNFQWAQSSARATAAVIDSPVPGSIYLINRQNDTGPNGTGVNLDMSGGGSISSSGAMYMSSTASGSPNYAGELSGSASVTAAYVGLRGGGTFDDSSNVTPAPSNGLPDGSNFKDPMRGKGQPPPPTLAQAPPVGVPNGVISSSGNNCVNLNPGSYYALDNRGQPSRNPIQISGCVNFTDGGTGFGNYVFYGGVHLRNPGSVMTMSPGRYIYAGVDGVQKTVYQQDNQVMVQDLTPLQGGQMVANNDAGELMVFTDSRYPGLQKPPALAGIDFQYGNVEVQSGNNAESGLMLHGLNATAGALPQDLKTFAPTVLWQDQGNSTIKYLADGNVDTSCGSLDSPCANNDNTVTTNGQHPSTSIILQATPGLKLYGVLYQPRGGSLDLQGSGAVSTPMVIITGTMNMGGGPTVLQPLTSAGLIRKMVALVE
jgi:hypothetical protein